MAALAGARAGLALVRRACGGGVTHGFGLLLRRQLSSLPPHTLLPMPALSPTMTTGNLAAWKKKAGDAIAAGDVIAEVETDKATVDYEVVDEGILAKILVPEGTQDVEVGTPVAVLVEDASHVDAFKDYVAKPDAPAPAPASESKAPAPSSEALAPASAAPAPAPAPAPASGSPAKKVGGVVSASPLARQLAASMGVSLSEVKGTGPGGRIIAADVSEAADAQKSAPPAAEEPAGSAAPAPSAPKPSKPGQSYVDIPHSNIRKVTAKNMVQNKNSNPHYYVTMEIGMDELIAMRKKANELLGAKISVNDYIIKAAALSLKEVSVTPSRRRGRVVAPLEPSAHRLWYCFFLLHCLSALSAVPLFPKLPPLYSPNPLMPRSPRAGAYVQLVLDRRVHPPVLVRRRLGGRQHREGAPHPNRIRRRLEECRAGATGRGRGGDSARAAQSARSYTDREEERGAGGAPPVIGVPHSTCGAAERRLGCGMRRCRHRSAYRVRGWVG
jgi:hypothetical protein